MYIFYDWRFNADANTGDAFGIFMVSIGVLRAPASINVGVSSVKRSKFHVKKRASSTFLVQDMSTLVTLIVNFSTQTHK